MTITFPTVTEKETMSILPKVLCSSKVHPTWIDLLPRKNFDHIDLSDESPEEYVARIQANSPNIPAEVLMQWPYLHILNEHMIDNYAWIDYSRVIFSEMEWTHEKLEQIKVYSEFRQYFESRKNLVSFDQFRCVEEDKLHWREFGTWRTPIVVLDSTKIKHIPSQSEIDKPYQLIEGHSRLGYYFAFYNLSKSGLFRMPTIHRLFLMQID